MKRIKSKQVNEISARVPGIEEALEISDRSWPKDQYENKDGDEDKNELPERLVDRLVATLNMLPAWVPGCLAARLPG